MPTRLTPAELSLRASIAANTRWANTSTAERRRQADRGQAGLLARFLQEVDPDNSLTVEEREKRAQNAYAAHMQRLALASSKARRGAAA